MKMEEEDMRGNDDGVIAQLIDIREPLSNLRDSLEARLGGMDLSQYNFWLQDSQMLPLNTSLVEQCVQGEGLVQINVEIKIDDNDGSKRINIVDVLKPSEDSFNADESENINVEEDIPSGSMGAIAASKSSESDSSLSPSKEIGTSGGGSQQETVTRWVVCSTFRKEQERLRIPTDPVQWNVAHVAHWAKWAKKEFHRTSIDLVDWASMNGDELCALTHDEFKRKVTNDPSDLLWTHLELLRKCKFVAVVQQKKETTSSSPRYSIGSANSTGGSARKTHKKAPVKLGTAKFTVMSESSSSPGNRTGNNGQIQLWQFLLELLTEKEHRQVIHWIGDEGEFKLNNPENGGSTLGNQKE